MEKTILVIGATGNQGGAVARHLLPAGFKVRALTRNPEAKKAELLIGLGAELVKGDLDDRTSLLAAMKGVDGVFCAINMRDGGVHKEEERGKRVANAVQETHVPHLVYSSVGGAERGTGIPHFESKRRIEEYIQTLEIPHTLLRPTAFMENFLAAPVPAFLSIMRSFLGETRLQMVSIEDIGEWVKHFFLEPASWMGKAVEIAGDELNYREIEDIYYRVTGKKTWAVGVPAPWALMMMGDFGKMFAWFKDHGYQADIEECRRTLGNSLTFERFLRLKMAPLHAKAA